MAPVEELRAVTVAPVGPAGRRCRIGVSGLGSIGAAHARALAERGVDLVFFDPAAASLEAAAGIPHQASSGSFERLLEGGLDGLVVATPDRFHVEQASAACERGIPVLVEKPISDDLETARRLATAQATSGNRVLVGYVLRHSRVLARVRTLMREGAIGVPVSFQVMLGAYETLEVARNRFRDPPPGGLFLDYSHEWDYVNWLLSPIRTGFALAGRVSSLPLVQDPNLADGALQLASGATGTFHLDYVQKPGRRRLTVVGDRGTLDADVAAGLVRVQGHGDETVREYREPDARLELLGRQADHFLDVVAGREPPRVTVEDGIAALRVALALRRSSIERAWVTVGD
jgi:predicted dehydrogenase